MNTHFLYFYSTLHIYMYVLVHNISQKKTRHGVYVVYYVCDSQYTCIIIMYVCYDYDICVLNQWNNHLQIRPGYWVICTWTCPSSNLLLCMYSEDHKTITQCNHRKLIATIHLHVPDSTILYTTVSCTGAIWCQLLPAWNRWKCGREYNTALTHHKSVVGTIVKREVRFFIVPNMDLYSVSTDLRSAYAVYWQCKTGTLDPVCLPYSYRTLAVMCYVFWCIHQERYISCCTVDMPYPDPHIIQNCPGSRG